MPGTTTMSSQQTGQVTGTADRTTTWSGTPDFTGAIPRPDARVHHAEQDGDRELAAPFRAVPMLAIMAAGNVGGRP